MTPSTRAASLALVYVTFVLSCFSCFNNEVAGWQSGSSNRMMTMATRTTRRAHPSNEGGVTSETKMKLLEPSSSTRRKLLFRSIPKTIGAAIAATATTVLVLPHPSCNAAAPASGGLTADAARDQWKQSVKELDDLLQNWSTVSEGDAGPNNIRKKLGFFGATSSPFFQIEKAFKVLRDSDEYVEDGIEFFETAEEFVVIWVRADSLADSANLKTGSGKQTPPEVFIENSKTQVVELQLIAKKLNSMLLK